jgi:hypothetical protein
VEEEQPLIFLRTDNDETPSFDEPVGARQHRIVEPVGYGRGRIPGPFHFTLHRTLLQIKMKFVTSSSWEVGLPLGPFLLCWRHNKWMC